MTTLTDLNSVPGIVEKLFLETPEFKVAEDPSVRRQSALTMLAKFAQETTGSRQLFVEAAVLASRTLESDHFVTAHLQTGSSTCVAISGTRPTVNSEVEIVETTFDRNDNRCLVSQALQAGEPLIIDDLSAEQRSHDPLMTKLNARSALICPIQYGSCEYGAVGVLSLQPKRAELEDVRFLQTISLLLGPTVACQHTEAVLAQHSAMHNATIESLDSMVLVLSSEGKIIRANKACEDLSGFKSDDLKNCHFWGVYLLPEEVSIATDAFGKLRLGQSPVKCDMFLLTKSGERRRISWSFTHLPQTGDQPTSYVASGIDITEQHEALETAERSDGSHSAGHSQNDDSAPIPKNRRNTLRKEFPYLQLIGPIRDGQLPKADDYQEVRCRDISPSGFSYFAEVPPDYQELVVALGAYPSQLYLTAQIIHVNRFRRDGQDMMLVGCQYTSRVDP